MDGGILSIWLKVCLSKKQKIILKQYESYLQSYKIGYSFLYGYRKLEIMSNDERSQIENAIGYIPKQELAISGLADPMFRAIEALLKYFGGYLAIGVDVSAIDKPKGEYYPIITYDNYFRDKYVYHLVSWEFVAGYFNRDDDKGIRDVYSLDRFSLNPKS